MIFKLLLAIFLISACNFHEDKKGPNDGPVVDGAKLDFAGITEVLFKSRCYSCHSASNKNGGLAVDSYEEVKAKADKIKARAVTQKSMPPGSGLGENNRATLAQWIDAGLPN